MEKIAEINEQLENVLKQISEKESETDTLKQNEFVIKYLDSLSQLDKLNLSKRELQINKMENCAHYFIIHAVDDGWDGHRCNYSNIATCIHCGLTNRFGECSFMWEEFPYNKMKRLIQDGAMSVKAKYHGYYDFEDLDEIKKLYDDYREHNRDMSDSQIEKQIAKVKKPKQRFGCII